MPQSWWFIVAMMASRMMIHPPNGTKSVPEVQFWGASTWWLGKEVSPFHWEKLTLGIINDISIDPVICFTEAGMKSLSGTPSTGTPKQKTNPPRLKTPKSKPSSKPQESIKEDQSDEIETIYKVNPDSTDVLAKVVRFALSCDYWTFSRRNISKIICEIVIKHVVYGESKGVCARHPIPYRDVY